ncbi:MAG: helix-turn-helix domain-containing protein [Patescibacteria group bacterium]|jgi:predicted DNA-binding mobile mystery protein A
MKNSKRSLQIEQLDKKIKTFKKLEHLTPSHGWVYAVRTSLGISLEQLGRKMGITAQSVRELEQREKNSSISLKSLDEAARGLGLKLTYGFSAPDKNLNEMIKLRANKMAEKIVSRTHKTMQLENQANSRARIRKAIREKAAEIADKNTKYLWD